MPRAVGGQIRLLGTAVSRKALFLLAAVGSAIVVGDIGTQRLMGRYSDEAYYVIFLGAGSLFLNLICFVVASCAPKVFERQWLLGLVGFLVLGLGGAALVITFLYSNETVGLVAGSLGLFIAGALILKETNVVKKTLAKSFIQTELGEVRNGGFGVGLVCSLIMYVTVASIILSENIGPKFLTFQEFNPIDSFRLSAVVAGGLCLITSTVAMFYGHRVLGDRELKFYCVITFVLLLCSAIFPTLSGERITSMSITLFAAMCCSASIAKDLYHQGNKNRKKNVGQQHS